MTFVSTMGAAPPAEDMCRTVGRLVPLPGLPEASGIAIGRGSSAPLFAISDSGLPLLIELSHSGNVMRTIAVNGAELLNWEAMTTARCGRGSCIYIGDIGDNHHQRRFVTIYRVDEQAVAKSSAVQAERFDVVYPDGPHDAEALFATGEDQLFVVTKETGGASIFRLPAPLRPAEGGTMAFVGTVRLPNSHRDRVTDAAVTPDGKWTALRTNDDVFLYRSSELLSGHAPNPARIDLRGLHEPQGEGVTFGPDNTMYLIGEGGGKDRPGSFVAMQCEFPQ